MDVEVRLGNLARMHPQLLWDTFIGATTAVFEKLGPPPFQIAINTIEVPNFEHNSLQLIIEPPLLPEGRLEQLKRTFEPARLVEFAAIAVAGLSLYHAGRHELHDVAPRGSGGDYVVDNEECMLEIAGRSRLGDFRAAWDQRWQRLLKRGDGSFYVFVAEFETPSGRLAFSG